MDQKKYYILRTEYGYDIKIFKRSDYNIEDYYIIALWDRDNVFYNNTYIEQVLYDTDKEISILLDITKNKYQNIMIDNFNAYKTPFNNIKFNNGEDAIKAGEWLSNSLVLSKIK
jgi:hypothetical protein